METYKRSQQNLSRALSSEQLQIVATPITDFIMTGRRTARCVCNAGRWAQWGLISLFALAIRLKACGILESIHLEPSGEPGHLEKSKRRLLHSFRWSFHSTELRLLIWSATLSCGVFLNWRCGRFSQRGMTVWPWLLLHGFVVSGDPNGHSALGWAYF